MFRKFNIRNKLNIIVGQDRVSFDQETNTLLVPVNFVSSLDFLHFIQTYPYSHLRILSSSLITKEVLEAIRDNANIYFVKLGSVDDPYSLSREDFDILNANEHLYSIDTDDVLGEYKSDEMEYLSFFQKSVVGKYSVQNLMFDSFFSFFEKIDDKQISYLKRYIHPQAQIEFHYDQYDNIIQVIQELKEKQLHYHLVKFDDFFQYITSFQKLLDQGENISINQPMNLKDYLLVDSILDLMVKDIRNSHLSPYEKYLAVWEIITHFKSYLENEENKMEARSLEYILFNSFFVCYGFVELMVALLDKVGIKAKRVAVEFYKESREVSLADQARMDIDEYLYQTGNIEYHSRLLVRLVDPKYQIDGIYVGDPTWDNTLTHHYFNHSLMTFYEMGLENTEFYESDLSLFAVNHASEFFQMIERRPSAIATFLEIIEVIDPDYYRELDLRYNMDQHSMEFLQNIYNYLIAYTKKPVYEDIQSRALNELFRFIYPAMKKEEYEHLLKSVLDENKNRDHSFFKEGRGR